MSERPVTLEEIARRAGVSKNTVSVALRNRPGVGEATRERIKTIAEELGYRPNPMLSAHMQQLRMQRPSQKSANIAFVYYHPNENEAFQADFLKGLWAGMKQRGELLGYSAMLIWAGKPGMTKDRLRSVLIARGVQGIVFAPLPKLKKHICFDWDDFACATLGHTVLRPQMHRACSNLATCLDLAIRTLKKRGYKRIGVCIDQGSDMRNNYIWSGALAMHKMRHQHWLCEAFIHQSPYDPAFKKWLKQEQPDAVVEAGSLGLWEALQEMGIRLPEDMGYVDALGNDDEASRHARVIRRWNELGAAGCDLVTSQLMRNERGLPQSPKTMFIDGIWKEGNTIRPL
ncbi:LacI family DNA-binding transcriptional regulator [Kiritimatiellota bacterium B12222]|nr:LacI family DNA-binding transcriptional regulator [Kiritimatiellota bacterium B12222]